MTDLEYQAWEENFLRSTEEDLELHYILYETQAIMKDIATCLSDGSYTDFQWPTMQSCFNHWRC